MPPTSVVIGATGLPLPSTRAERTNYRETSSHADVMAFIDSLVLMKAPIVVQEMAKSTGRKSVPLIIASRPRVSSPVEARRTGRPIVYLQANIHAGEVEGKEAVLALLREWSFGRSPNILDSLVLIVVPIYNADGNDKLADQARNRSAQNGPAQIGERANGMGLDLNRDYIKAEAPETRGALAMLNAWEPDVFMDLHTTNGSYHGYALTYSPALHPAAPLTPYTADTLLPEIQRRMRQRHRLETFAYGNFATIGSGEEVRTPTSTSGWFTYDHRPRFGTNYYGLRGRISILSEAYSHDSFAQRVASTRHFVQETMSLLAERRTEVRSRITAGVARSTFLASNTVPVALKSQFSRTPNTQPVRFERLEKTKDTTRQTEPGTPAGLRRTGRMVSRQMTVVDRFEPALTRVPSPHGYVFDESWLGALLLLRIHGVTVIPLARAMIATMQVFDVDSVAKAPVLFQGHRETTIRGRWRDTTRVLPAGTLVVAASTPRDLLGMMLIDPESDDGLFAWNVFDGALGRGKEAPVARLTAPLRLYSPGRSGDKLYPR